MKQPQKVGKLLYCNSHVPKVAWPVQVLSSQLSMDEHLGKVVEQLASDAQPGHAQDVHLELWL